MTQRSLAAAALVLATSIAAAAHDGHDHKLMGTVALLHEQHLEVEATDGERTTFTLDEQTKVLRGARPVTPSDIVEGERVVVIYRTLKQEDGSTKTAVREVRLGTSRPGDRTR